MAIININIPSQLPILTGNSLLYLRVNVAENGIEWAATAGGGITIGTTAIASGTVGRVIFEGTGNVVQQNANFIWDNTNSRLGIREPSPDSSVVIRGAEPATSTTTFGLKVHNSTGTNNALVVRDDGLVAVRPNLSLIPPTNFHVGGTGNIAAFGSSSSIGTGVVINVAANGHGRITAFAYNTADPSSTAISTGASLGFNGSGNNFYGIGLAAAVNSRFDLWFQTGAFNGGGYRFYTSGTNERFRITNSGSLLAGTTTEIGSSILTLESNSRGLLPPRMITANRDAIATPAAGLMIYNTTTNRPNFFDGTNWIAL